MEILALVTFIILSSIAIMGHLLGLPCNWAILVFSFLLAWLGDFNKIQIPSLIVLFSLSFLGEIMEFVIGIIGAKKVKTSNWAIVASFIFGLAGAILGAPFFLGIGAIIGAFAGAFIGTFTVELFIGKNLHQSILAGWGTLLGKLGGSFAKMTIGITMVVVTLTTYFKN